MRGSSRVAARALTHALAGCSGASSSLAREFAAPPTASLPQLLSGGAPRRAAPSPSSLARFGDSADSTRSPVAAARAHSTTSRYTYDAKKGFADCQGDDMAFVEVDMGMVSHAPTAASCWSDDGVSYSSDLTRVRHYRVCVTTASSRGAGTSGRVELTLVGDEGVSEAIPLEYERDTNPGFARGSTLPFRITTYADTGALASAQVRLVPEMSQVGHGWLLDNFSLTSEETGQKWTFRSKKWFGAADSGGKDGPLQQLMSPSAETEVSAEATNRPKVFLDVSAGAACVPHVEKTKEGARAVMQREWGHGGEDAYFVKKVNIKRDDDGDGVDDTCVAFGVADGVYMWRQLGIDAGLYSRKLMGLCSDAFATVKTTEDDSFKPQKLLEAAYEGCTAEALKGSTTACVLTVDATHGVLRGANIGDSGFMIVRGAPGERECVHRSPPQEHEFGRPFQLGHHEASDKPFDAMLTTFQLDPGDVLIMGSDGLWDNLSESEIVELVEKVFVVDRTSGGKGAENARVANAAAREIVTAAYAASMDKRRSTPYSLAATEFFDMVYSGGKKDDITVVVANVG